MNNNYIRIRKTNTSKISQQIKRNVNTSSNNNISSHYSSKVQSDFNSKNICIPFDNSNKLHKNNKASNTSLLAKRGQMNPSLYNRNMRLQCYESVNKTNDQIDPRRENINQRLHLNNNNNFNDKQNHLSFKEIFEYFDS